MRRRGPHRALDATAAHLRYRHVSQRGNRDCGVAALATILNSNTGTVGYDQIAAIVVPSAEGTDLWTLSNAANQLGYTAQGLKGPYDAIATVGLPVIAHLRNRHGHGHFVVLQRWSTQSVTITDPARGVRELSRKRFCRLWTGYLLTVLTDTLV
jgi:ATP-binding cassette, subfamily C, bacteriocin exporter